MLPARLQCGMVNDGCNGPNGHGGRSCSNTARFVAVSRIAYAWELGGGFGHIGPFLPLARALRQRGHDVQCVVARVDLARQLAGDDFAWIPAPVFPEALRQGSPLSYSDILLRFGYAQADELYGLVQRWRDIFRQTGAAIVVADHAPTAMLAARTLGLPVLLFSSAFCVPPRLQPLPAMRPWHALPSGTLEGLDGQVLCSINAVLQRFGQAPLQSVGQLFDVAEDSLLGFPELDHYADRGPARYWGNLPAAGGGATLRWPGQPGKRVFAYLRTESLHHEAALSALVALGQPSFVFFPEAPQGMIERHAAPHMAFSRDPIDLASAMRDADAGITYANLSTTTGLLLNGKPGLTLPVQLEQFLLARRVEEMGAGLLVHPEQGADDLPEKLRRILFDAEFAQNARAFARKYAAFPQTAVIGNIVRRIEELVAPA